MTEKVSVYTGKEIEITYDRGRCIHAAECGRGSKALFDASQDPWCNPDAVAADQALAIVARCPSGALSAKKNGKTVQENMEGPNVVQVYPHGPLYVQGQVTVGGKAVGNRFALCRCGKSMNKPFCDGAHESAGFKDAGPIATDPDGTRPEVGSCNVALAKNGPLLIQGAITLRAASGRDACHLKKGALCRCGASQNKPYCDGSHNTIGFEASDSF